MQFMFYKSRNYQKVTTFPKLKLITKTDTFRVNYIKIRVCHIYPLVLMSLLILITAESDIMIYRWKDSTNEINSFILHFIIIQ